MEPIRIPVCSLYCLARLDGNHRRTHGLPDPDQVIRIHIAKEDYNKWTISDGIIFTENGVKCVFLTAYSENSVRVCITLDVLMDILAKQKK